MIGFFAELGAWNWLILGAVLLMLELLSPGVYFLWIGVAALLTGTISLQVGDAPWWGWEVQTVLFLALALAAVAAARFAFPATGTEDSDEPFLNRREQQLIGRIATLEEDLRDGVGRIRLGDSLWRVSGPDLPAGTRVRVVRAEGTTLTVEPA